MNRRQTDGEGIRRITITCSEPGKEAASKSGLLILVCDGLREREHTPGGLRVTSVDAQTPPMRSSEERNNVTGRMSDVRLPHSQSGMRGQSAGSVRLSFHLSFSEGNQMRIRKYNR